MHRTSSFLEQLWYNIGSVPLRAKIMGMAVGIALMTGIFSIYLVQRALSVNITAHLMDLSLTTARELAARVEISMAFDDMDGIRTLFADTRSIRHDIVQIYILGPRGKLRYETSQGIPLPDDIFASFAHDSVDVQKITTRVGPAWNARAPLAAGQLGTLGVIVSESENRAIIAELISSLTYSMLGIMAAAIGMAAFLTWIIVRPVKALMAGTQAVRRGDYSVKILESPGDEIGVLIKDFNDMTIQLRSAEEARLEKELMRQDLLKRIISSQEGERKRIARELHDQTGQSLAALMVGLKIIEKATTVDEVRKNIAELKKNLTRELETIHQMAVELRPNILDDAGIVVGLRHYVEDFQKKYGMECRLVIIGFDQHRLPLHVETAIYRVIQEALTNVMRHAGAKNVQVILEWRQDGVRGVVSDDGAGFDISSLRPGRLGIYGMEERITLLGGEFTIESEQAEGTMVTFRLPEASFRIITGEE